MIRIREVIAILDAGAQRTQTVTDPLIEAAMKEGKMEQISPEEIKSYVITDDKVYASPISSVTLKKRADFHLKQWK
ncbi:protein of unknown function [Lihuaxuella thermophila]|uniref:DUF370 domain-containing protein n=2 Tax=Lihuaxuella thermophila TaxID=1173111 RepID=A0A1H8BN55_9BACL|nr:protein of unknown function [Lihuaxuella thermophila]